MLYFEHFYDLFIKFVHLLLVPEGDRVSSLLHDSAGFLEVFNPLGYCLKHLVFFLAHTQLQLLECLLEVYLILLLDIWFNKNHVLFALEQILWVQQPDEVCNKVCLLLES